MSERGGAATRDLHRRDQRPRNRRMTSSTADTAPTAPFYRIDWRQRSRVYCSGVQRHASPAVAIRSAANSTAVGQTPALSPSGYPPQIRQSISKHQASFSFFVGTTHNAHARRCKWVGEQKISCSTFPFALDDGTAASCPQHVRGILFFLCGSRPATRALVGFLVCSCSYCECSDRRVHKLARAF